VSSFHPNDMAASPSLRLATYQSECPGTALDTTQLDQACDEIVG